VNILAISHLFPHIKEPRYGIFAARQLSGLRRLGADITVIVPRVWCPAVLRHFEKWREHDHTTSLCKFEDLETIAIPYIRPPGNWYNRWAGLAAFLAMKKKAEQLHRQHKFEIIYATDIFPDGDAAVRLGRYLHVPAACLAIGVDVNVTARSSKRIYRRFAQVTTSLDGILACGQSVAEGIRAVASEEPLCVYGVLDLEEFSPVQDKKPVRTELGLPFDRTIVLYAGYLARRKGVYELLDAFDGVCSTHRDVMLVMCGGGSEQSELKRLVQNKGIEGIVRLVGEVEPEQMSKWMQASDLFVLASHTEGMPNVVMEAMASGLAVIATSVGGLPAAIGDCEGAILIPPKDIEALQKAIADLVSCREFRERMGAAGRKRAEEKFSVDRNAHAILNYLEKVAAKNRSWRAKGATVE